VSPSLRAARKTSPGVPMERGETLAADLLSKRVRVVVVAGFGSVPRICNEIKC